MQTNIESTTLRPQPLIVPFRDRSTDHWRARTQPSSVRPVNDLVGARQVVLQAQRCELVAWLGIILGALGVLVLSFWF